MAKSKAEANEPKSKKAKVAPPWFASRPHAAVDFSVRFISGRAHLITPSRPPQYAVYTPQTASPVLYSRLVAIQKRKLRKLDLDPSVRGLGSVLTPSPLLACPSLRVRLRLVPPQGFIIVLRCLA